MNSGHNRFNVFSYREEEPRRDEPPVVRPTVDLALQRGSRETQVRALVDTGAPRCVFGRAVGDLLGIDMRPRKATDAKVRILGDTHDARVEMVLLDLPPFAGLSWETEVAFLYENLELSFAGVLGQTGFLDRWAASFNLGHGYFIIEESDAFHDRVGPALLADTATRSPLLDSEWDRPSTE